VASAIGSVCGMASTLSLALMSLGSGVVHAQVHLHDEGCADEAMERKKSTKKWVRSLAGVDAQEQADSLLYINQIGDYALFWHPLLRGEEAQNILLHKQRFGNILDAAELVQCGFSVDRIREIKDHLICDAALSWQKQQWLEKAKGRERRFIHQRQEQLATFGRRGCERLSTAMAVYQRQNIFLWGFDATRFG